MVFVRFESKIAVKHKEHPKYSKVFLRKIRNVV